MVWVRKEFNDHLPLPSTIPGCSKPCPTGLKHLQGWSCFSGQPVLAPYHLHRGRISSQYPSKPALCQAEPIPPCSASPDPCSKSLSRSPRESFGIGRSSKISLELSFLQTEQTQLSQPVSRAELSTPLSVFMASLHWHQQLHILHHFQKAARAQ